MNRRFIRITAARPRDVRVLSSLDPRLTLLATLLYVVVVSSLPHGAWTTYGLATALILGIVVLSGLSVPRLLRRSLVVLPIAAVAAVSVLFSVEGSELFSLRVLGGRLVATREGAVSALSLTAKAYLSVLMSSVLVASSGFTRVIDAMRALRVPDLLTQTIAFAYRYLHVLVNEASRMLTARESRSAGSGRTLWWRARVLGGMIGTLFIRSLSRSERVYFAMQARGFHGEIVSLAEIRWTRRDTAAALLWFFPLAAISVFSRVIYG